MLCNQPGVGLVSRVQLLHVLPCITSQAWASGCDGTRSVKNMDMETRPLPCARAKVRGAHGPSSHSNECNTGVKVDAHAARDEGSMILCKGTKK